MSSSIHVSIREVQMMYYSLMMALYIETQESFKQKLNLLIDKIQSIYHGTSDSDSITITGTQFSIEEMEMIRDCLISISCFAGLKRFFSSADRRDLHELIQKVQRASICVTRMRGRSMMEWLESVDLTSSEVALILRCLNLAYPVLAIQLLDPEEANEVVDLIDKFEFLQCETHAI